MSCYCGKKEDFEKCCKPIIAGEVLAKTAEQLMRARYSAFAIADIDFIMDTHAPSTVHQIDRKESETWAKDSTWLGLDIISTEDGGENDETGVVEFDAKYVNNTTKVEHTHHEHSFFRKIDGKWYFEDTLPEKKKEPIRKDKIGRNDPCPCGSGKKYKKCCQ